VIPPIQLVFNGIAAASDGSLTPITMEPPLLGGVTPDGMHMWIQATITLPLVGKTGSDPIIDLRLVAQLGVFGQINGQQRIATFMNSFSSCGGMKLAGMQQAVQTENIPLVNGKTTAKFQLFARADAIIGLHLKQLIGFGPDLEFTASRSASTYLFPVFQLLACLVC